MNVFILIGLLIAVIFWCYQKYMQIVDKVKHIPGPPARPFIGNAGMFLGKSPRQVLDIGIKFVKKYGIFCRILLGPKVLILMGDPSDVEVILTSQTILDKSEEYEFVKPWIGEGLITSTGNHWFTHRKVITPAFHFKILEQFIEIFERNGDVLVQKLSLIQNKPLDIFAMTLLCALDNICEAAMGTKMNAQLNSDSQYVQAVNEITSIVTKRHFMFPLRSDLIFRMTPLYGRQKKLLKILHSFTDNVIVTRRRELAEKQNHNEFDENSNIDIGIKKKMALFDILLQATIDGKPLSNQDIREEVDTFTFAGHDTTTSGISFCLYNLSKYPEVQQKVFDEIRSVIGDDKYHSMNMKNLNDLHYLDLVIKESLRLFPSVPFFGRKIKEDIEINGKFIPRGANVCVSPFVMGRSEIIWSEPEKFIPERFEVGNNIHPFAYLPFSAGSRNCIGQKFAMLEMKSTVSKILRHYQINLAPDFKLSVISEIVLRPQNGIILELKARSYE